MSFYWYDFETFGADPFRDRPCQFFELWIEFFLRGVQVAAQGTISKVVAIRELEHDFKMQLADCRSPKPAWLPALHRSWPPLTA